MSDTRPIDNLRTALETWGAVNPGGSSLEIMKARRGFLHTAVTDLMNGVVAEERGLLASEGKLVARSKTVLAEIDERVLELEDEKRWTDAGNETRRLVGASERVVGGWSVTGEPDAYSDPYKDPTGPSFFRDMARARVGQPSAFAAASKSASALPIWTASEWARTSTAAPVTYVIHSSRGRSMTVPPSADGVRDAGTADHPSLATVAALAGGDTEQRSSLGDDWLGVLSVASRRRVSLHLARCRLSSSG